MPANDQLTALDATFLELEEADDSAVMHIGGALLFAPLTGGATPAIGKVREHLERRLDLLPRYQQKLSAPHTGGLSWPSWEADQRFEIEAHVRHATLPSPGEEGEFLEWVSDFYSAPSGSQPSAMGDRAARRSGGWPLGVGVQDPPLTWSVYCSTRSPPRPTPARPTPRACRPPSTSRADGSQIYPRQWGS